MNNTIPSPEKLPENAEFFNFDGEGIPVARVGVDAFRYDTDPPRYFAVSKLIGPSGEGIEISRDDFMAMVKR